MGSFPWDRDRRPASIHLTEIPFTPEKPGTECRIIPFLNPLITSISPGKITENVFKDMVNISREPSIVTGENPERGFVAGQNTRLVIGDGTALIPNLLGLNFSKKEIGSILTDCAKSQQQLIGQGDWQNVTKDHVNRTLEGKYFDIPSLLFLDWCQGDISRHLNNSYRRYSDRAMQFRERNMGLAVPIDGLYVVHYYPYFDHKALTGADQEFIIYNRPDEQDVAEIRRMIPDDLWTNKLPNPDPENPEHWFLLLGQITAPFIRGIVKIEQHHESLQKYVADQNARLENLAEHIRNSP